MLNPLVALLFYLAVGGARHSIWAFELRSPGDHVTTVVFVPAPKGLVKEIASRFVCVLGFRRFSGYRNRNNRLTSSQEFSRCFAAGDCADHCRSEYGIAALEDTSSTKIRSRKRRVPIAGKKSSFQQQSGSD